MSYLSKYLYFRATGIKSIYSKLSAKKLLKKAREVGETTC